MTVETIDVTMARTIVAAMATAVRVNRDQLSALDAALGDGDHGHNLAAALDTAVAALKEESGATPGLFLAKLGRSLINNMGGASGIIFGSFFVSGGKAVGEKEALMIEDVVAFFENGIAKVQQRGKAVAGDKTMLDALMPAVAALKTAVVEEATLAAAMLRTAVAAEQGAAATAAMTARHGRARFLGERSIGHQDAGATSMALMLSAWAAVMARE